MSTTGELRAARRALGQCECGEPGTGGRRCGACVFTRRHKKRFRYDARTRSVVRVQVCAVCGRAGHNARRHDTPEAMQGAA